MLLSPRQNGLDSLFKEVRVLKAIFYFLTLRNQISLVRLFPEAIFEVVLDSF